MSNFLPIDRRKIANNLNKFKQLFIFTVESFFLLHWYEEKSHQSDHNFRKIKMFNKVFIIRDRLLNRLEH